MPLPRRLVLCILALSALVAPAHGQSTTSAFTYQGRLTSTGVPANGLYDFRFTVWSNLTGGLQQGTNSTLLNQTVQNGLFSAKVDVGNVFYDNSERYLQVEVRPAGGATYTTLSPRQLLTAAPYASGLVLPYNMHYSGTEPPFTIYANMGGVSAMSVDNGSGTAITANGSQFGVKSTAYGVGIYGVHNGAFSGQPAIQGDANDNFFVTTGILGRLTAATVPSGSCAVRGQVLGTGGGGAGVWGSQAGIGWGVFGETDGAGLGIVGESTGAGGAAIWGNGLSGAQAGRFSGNVQVIGTLSKSGGSFQIDHPLDPANKYLYHSFVESPDMMNIYNGNAQTDDRGLAIITLPEWFEALNRDFRYQLTVIDEADSAEFTQAKVIAGVRGNQFAIRTSEPHATVSWQVTGIRKDAWANANRIPVEQDKSALERGHYLHPELHGQPKSASIDTLLPRAIPEK